MASNMNDIKTGDKVLVLSGKDKGAEGEVMFTHRKQGRVTVRGVNLVKKALHPTQVNPNGGIDTREAPIDASNVMLVCPSCGVPTRIAHRREGSKKVRVCKKCGKDID